MSESATWGRYAELHPDQLATIIGETPIAFVPWGGLAWRGPHLPFGLGGMIAEALAERAVQRTGGVLMPTTWWPIAGLPHPTSLSIPSEVVQALWDGIFGGLATVGVRAVVLLSGHHSHGHELVLIDAAEHAISEHRLMVLAIPPLALVGEEMLDHGALWETALLLALRPRLVRIEKLDEGPLTPSSSGVIGDNPRGATPTQGESVLSLATERIVRAVESLLSDGNPAGLRELYARRRARYQEYVERYFRGSWEDASVSWWNDIK